MAENQIENLGLRRELPVGSVSHHAPAWWGMWSLIASEASLFIYLLFSYVYLAGWASGRWVPELPKLHIAGINTAILVASSVVLWWGEQAIKKGKSRRLLYTLVIALAMGIVFVALQAYEWHDKKFLLRESAYASTYFVTTGFHLVHVVGGLLVIAALLLWTALGKFNEQRHAAVSIGALYWHFVDVVWLAIFATFYISPYLTS
jgi:cytochrome c oxidase subunit 3